MTPATRPETPARPTAAAGSVPAGAADLPLGAHLVTPRRGYTHHGIHVGGGRVVHYVGWSRAWLRGPVEETTLEGFAGGREVRVEPSPDARFAPHEVVARARSRLGEDRYRLASNNCEHFCAWCLSGQSRSAQVDRIAGALRAAARGLHAAYFALAPFPPPWRPLGAPVV
jgi:hypothetical protein